MQLKAEFPRYLNIDQVSEQEQSISHSINHQTGLTVSGDLMSNEFGAQVAQDSDDGFPWQMSVRIEPTAIEEIQGRCIRYR